jgi:ribosomal protein S18 acetylase RimI-like enzyme
MMPPDPLCEIAEEACLNAWPALQEVHYDGWILRFADGYTRRTNSVNAVRRGVLPIRYKIAHCEALYGAHGLPLIFRVLSYSGDGLDAHLAAQGFSVVDETSTLYAELPRALPPPGHPVVLNQYPPGEEWLAARRAFQGSNASDTTKLDKILGALAIPAAFGAVRGPDGRIASIAKGAVHRGIAVLNLVASDPNALRQGYSRSCVAAILNWARREHGAKAACLQVVSNNAPAISLYCQLGFTRELYRYHYRVRA